MTNINKQIKKTIKNILKEKKITEYEIEVNSEEKRITLIINDITSTIEYDFTDFAIKTNFLNFWGNFLLEQIKKILKKEKWIVCLKDGCNIDSIKLCDGVSIEYDYNNLMNAISIIGCAKTIKKFNKSNCSHIEICVKDSTVQTCANNRVQTVGQFITRLGINNSSRRAGTKNPSTPISSNIYCFVVDTGIQPNHPDLRVSSSISRNFTTRNTGAWADDNGHGTHVAGIISALDNNIGIVGNSPNVNIVAIKVLNRSGSGSITNIINALNYINTWKNNNPSARCIVNMSLGGGFYAPLNTAVENLVANNIIVCVAAGNSSSNASSFSPASAPNAITVGSYNSANNIFSSFSNFGTLVDILAPGEAIDSTWLRSSYNILSGTSMATPMVTGIVADLINSNPSLTTPTQVRTKLLTDSSVLNPTNQNGTTGSNSRITLNSNATNAGTTNISVYGGTY
jgi:subtilisin family serine protease